MAICPKCHQPLEDDADGEYICCAGEELQWRCRQCAKVSEGFAFPYGLCPHCGGALQRLGVRSFESDPAREAIRTAFEIELGGRGAAVEVAAEAKDPALADLFTRFAEMEGEHMTTLARRYHVAAPSTPSTFSLARAAIYAGVHGAPHEAAELFRVAIALEDRAANYFDEKAHDTALGSAERELYRELAAEEREHASLLTGELERWQQGKSGQMVA
jgi:glutamate synthase (NADPH) small chain